jgi:8-oxo-dGTP pyrophosphatase MutT (NUDIX family)
MALPSFDAFVDGLRGRLEAPLPGHAAHATMAPRSSVRREALSTEGRSCREAGVLALLFPSASSPEAPPTLVLTVRRDDLPDHGGQVSFPGGQREPADASLQETALREAREEINLDPAPVRLLGALTPLYIPPSNFCVHPFVGVAEREPSLRPTDREVGRILRVPLPLLLAPDTRTVETWALNGSAVDVPFYAVEDQAVWGATAMMVAELLAVCRPGVADA